jgi:hypothetical protein
LTLLTAINVLWRDDAFLRLVTEEQAKDRPELVGNIGYEA